MIGLPCSWLVARRQVQQSTEDRESTHEAKDDGHIPSRNECVYGCAVRRTVRQIPYIHLLSNYHLGDETTLWIRDKLTSLRRKFDLRMIATSVQSNHVSRHDD